MTFSTPSRVRASFSPGLGGRQDVQGIDPLVPDQCLVEGGLALDDIDEVVHHPALAVHDEIEVAQAYVKIDDDGLVAPLGETGADGGAGSGFAYATLS